MASWSDDWAATQRTTASATLALPPTSRSNERSSKPAGKPRPDHARRHSRESAGHRAPGRTRTCGLPLRRLRAAVRAVRSGPLTSTDSAVESAQCAPVRGGRRSLGSRVRSRARATSTPRLESGASGSSSFRCRRPVLTGAVPGYSVGDALSAVGGPAEAVGVELELRQIAGYARVPHRRPRVLCGRGRTIWVLSI